MTDGTTDTPGLYVGAYALCVKDGQMLLVRMSPSEVSAGMWALPGGGLNWGEAPADGVLRELTEETGLSGSVSGLAGIFSATYLRSPKGYPATMALPRRMTFGIFMAPFHEVGRNPTYALERDMQLIQWLDQLGFDEAWVGEHHSAGWEIISSPEMFLAAAAERTRSIKLGTGVVSLPYHHPLMVANRIVLLDHLSRGRAMLGVGPGALVTDALMLGLDPTLQRQRMDESMGVIMRLLTDPAPLTCASDWFQLHNASLHLRPYSQPLMPVAVASAESPAGMLTAGKHGAGVLSLGVVSGLRGAVNLPAQWAIAEEEGAKHGKTMNRQDWRLVIPVHIAESRKEALDDCRKGAARWQREYFVRTLGRKIPTDFPDDEVIDRMTDAGAWIVGTPDDLIAAIQRFDEVTGGFGGLMVTTVEWTSREKVWKSYELIADYVMPRFQGSLVGLEGSNRRSRAISGDLAAAREASLERAYRSHEEARAH